MTGVLRSLLAVVAVTTSMLSLSPGLAAAATVVSLTDAATPRTLEVGVGETLTFRNDDDERHRLRARDPEDVDTSDIDPRTSVTVTLSVAGTYRFVDERSDDPAYEVTVTVADDAATGGSGGGTTDSGGSPDDTTAPTTNDAPSSATVSMPSRSFSPSSVTIAVGGTVTWANRDGDHTVTARDSSFDSGIFDDGGSYRRSFASPGTYDYFCLLHPEMTGTVEVVGTGTATSPGSDRGAVIGGEGAVRSTPGDNALGAADPPSALSSPNTSGSGGRQGAGSPQDVALDIVDLAFQPATVELSAGTTVMWTNRGQAPHTVTSTGRGPLGSDTLMSGDSYAWTASEPGTYAYLCALHPEMTGELRVVVAGDGVAAATVEDEGDGSAVAPQVEPVSGEVVAEAAGQLTAASGEEESDDLPIISAMLLAGMAVSFVLARGTARR